MPLKKYRNLLTGGGKPLPPGAAIEFFASIFLASIFRARRCHDLVDVVCRPCQKALRSMKVEATWRNRNYFSVLSGNIESNNVFFEIDIGRIR